MINSHIYDMVWMKSHLSSKILCEQNQIKFLLTFQQEYHYILPDGTTIIKDEKDLELEKGSVNLGTERPSTTPSTTATSLSSEESSITP